MTAVEHATPPQRLYRIGNLCNGETRWSRQFVQPHTPAHVVETWQCDPDGQPITFIKVTMRRTNENR